MGVAAGEPAPARLESSKPETRMQEEKRIQAQSAPMLEQPAASSLLNVPGVKSMRLGVQEPRPKKETSKLEWNTEKLGSRLAVDAASAATSGSLIAPIITLIDKAIIENASGRRPMMSSVKASLLTLLLRPHHFLFSKPFALVFSLYSGTYLTANLLDTYKSTTNSRPFSSTTSGPSKFIATSTSNLALCLYKDSQFTKMFGAASTRPVPPITYALFTVRDSMTIFASFNLPAMIAPSLPLSEAAEKYMSRASAAQFLAPAAIQLFSTPLHLLGLDMYNRSEGSVSLRERLRKVRVDWLPSSLARMCRIIPAFGVGGVVNNGMRARGMKRLEE